MDYCENIIVAKQKETLSPATADNTDIERLSELALLVKAAQDALSDEMITRLSSVFSEGIALLDRLTRNEGLMYLLRELDCPENQRLLISLSNAFTAISQDITTMPQAKGGIIEAYKLICESNTQEGLKLMLLMSKHLSKSMRALSEKDN